MRLFILAALSALAATPARAEAPSMIEVTRVVEAPASEAFDVWTTSDGFARAFPGSALHEADLTPGGNYEIHWIPSAPEGQRGSEGCEVLAVVPDRVLAFTWSAPPQFGELRDERTQVVMTFEPLGPDRSRVTLRHLGFGEGGEWPGVREYFAQAWPAVMNRVVETLGVPGASEGFVAFLRPTRADFFETAPTPEEGAALRAHFVRLRSMTREGTVLFAGPCTDGIGPGIVLFEAADEASARKMIEEDPAVSSGVFGAEVHPIRFSLLRERDRP